MAEPSKQVGGYARVSVDAPDKVSPEMQAEAIEAQCKLKGWELVDLIVERGRSAGEGKKRPGLDRARKLIRTGKASGLVVWKIDRCSRSVRDFAEIPRRASPPRRRVRVGDRELRHVERDGPRHVA